LRRYLLQGDRSDVIPRSVEESFSGVVDVHQNLKDFGYVYFRYLVRGLGECWLIPQPQEVIPGGLEGVEDGMTRLKEGNARAVKYVFRLSDTPDIQE
jgi:NADPH2:quinone reductase